MLGGGVLFAVFPLVYASLFSGFYLAFMLVLLVMILRTVAIEFRSKEPSPRWRSAWDTVFGLASVGLALLLASPSATSCSGVPLDADGNITISLIDLLTPFALLVGVTTVAMFAMHGAIYLTMKTEGELQARIERVAAAADGDLLRPQHARRRSRWCCSDQQITARYIERHLAGRSSRPLRSSRWSPRGLLRPGETFWAFLASSAMIALLLISGAVGIYPEPAHLDDRPGLQPDDLQRRVGGEHADVCLIVALIGIPFVLLYTTGVYYIFRGKATVESDGY